MITVNINGKTITVQGHADTVGIGSMYMVKACMDQVCGSDANYHHDSDTGMVTVHTADLDYPMCAVDIVHLVQYLNHIDCPNFDYMQPPDVYNQFASYGDVAG